MTVLFFQKNFQYASNFVHNNQNAVAFWYAAGLSSYLMLKDIVAVEKIIIERSIYDAFHIDYAHLLTNVSVDIFDEPTSNNTVSTKKPVFLPSNDTHVYLFKSLLEELGKEKALLYCKEGENALATATKLGLINVGNEQDVLQVPNDAGVLVLGNDWGLVERSISNHYLDKGINTVCIQESILDLNPRDRRLMNCSFPIYQGLNSLKSIDLKGKVCAVIGNPRFETLKPVAFPQKLKAFINVNFTYGIFEEVRMGWIQDILDTLVTIDVDYIISQHPRDNGDLKNFKVLKSNAGIVHDTIKESTVVISRFSALLLEAVSLGRPAIYYNPHGEQMSYKLEPDNKALFYASTKEELLAILIKICSSNYVFSGSSMLNLHLGNTAESKASMYINRAINDLMDQPAIRKVSLVEKATVKLKTIKRKLL